MSQPTLFKYRRYQAEIILLCVRWYLRYSLNSLSYRDWEEMMTERGLLVDHTTIFRHLPLGSTLCSYSGKAMPCQAQTHK